MSRGSQIASFKAPVRPLDLFDIRFFLRAFYQTPDFLWVAGDGDAPTIGPSLTLTGSVSTGNPITLANGEKVQTETYNGVSYRASTAPNGITIGGSDDIVWSVICLGVQASGGDPFQEVLSTNVTGTPTVGFSSIFYQTGMFLRSFMAANPGGVTTNTGQVVTASAPVTHLAILDRGTQLCGQTTTLNQNCAAPTAGSLDSGRVCVGARPTGTNRYTGDIAAVVCWVGAGIANDWGASRVDDYYAQVGV